MKTTTTIIKQNLKKLLNSKDVKVRKGSGTLKNNFIVQSETINLSENEYKIKMIFPTFWSNSRSMGLIEL